MGKSVLFGYGTVFSIAGWERETRAYQLPWLQPIPWDAMSSPFPEENQLHTGDPSKARREGSKLTSPLLFSLFPQFSAAHSAINAGH